jgi:anti-anti-sigma factor
MTASTDSTERPGAAVPIPPPVEPRPGSCELVSESAEVAVVVLRGEADLSLAAALRQTLAGCSASSMVLVEMSECTFMDSSVIATLLGAARELRSGDSRGLALIAPGTVPRRMLEITGTADWLPIFPSREAAESAIGGAAAA